MAKKKVIEPLREGELRSNIERMFEIRAEARTLDAEFELRKQRVLATLSVREVRQYGDLRVIVCQNRNRGISWKETALALARSLYPTRELFRGWMRGLLRAHPRRHGTAYLRLTVVGGEEGE